MKILSFFFLFFYSCVNKMEDIDLSYSDINSGDFGQNIETPYYLKGDLEFQLIAPEMNQLSEEHLP